MRQINATSTPRDPNAPKPTYISLKKQPDGFTFYGRYKGTYKSTNPENGNPKNTHYFETPNGDVGVNGTAQLDDLVAQIAKNDYASITKIGLKKSKTGRSVVQVNMFLLSAEEYAEKTGTPKLPF